MAPKSSSSASSTTKKASSKDTESATTSSSSRTKTPKITPDTEFILRPHKLTDLANASKIYVSPQLLQLQGWSAGSFVRVIKDFVETTGVLQPWIASDEETYGIDVILMSPIYFKHAGFQLGNRVQLKKMLSPVPYAESVTIETNGLAEKDVIDALSSVGIILDGLLIKDKTLKVDSVNTKSIEQEMQDLTLNSNNVDDDDDITSLKPYLFHPKTTKISIIQNMNIEPKEKTYSYSKIGGLDEQISKIQRIISVPLNKPYLYTRFGKVPPTGLLLTGPSGTGKSMLLNAISYESEGTHIININGPSIVSKYLGGTEEKLREYFREAKKYRPSIIFIDEIDSLVPSRNSEDSTEVDSRVVATLLTLLDGLKGSVAVIGATNRINSIDPSLRRRGRFDHELEIGIPDAEGRYDILVKQFDSMKGNHTLQSEDIRQISEKTHGYVGADLDALCCESIDRCIQRSLEDTETENSKVTLDDVEEAMKDIRPSAMREIVLEMPNVRWDDIGGQTVLKRKLKEMVELPLVASHTFKKFGVTAPKGLLLYGPPGCSKTLTAKALATESGLNFLAVKGPELFNKYVGESERAIREIFRKARAAAPSIIFFDEIDAIATNREDDSGSNAAKQVLNSMLNEIDGVEELKGVVILGATNRPDIIDPALLRPGRLDRHVYVGPPDYEARLQILQKNTKKFELQESETLLKELAEMTDGFSGSEVVLLCQEAGLSAIRENVECEFITSEHFYNAIKDISKNITPEMLAYYEEFAEKYKAV